MATKTTTSKDLTFYKMRCERLFKQKKSLKMRFHNFVIRSLDEQAKKQEVITKQAEVIQFQREIIELLQQIGDVKKETIELLQQNTVRPVRTLRVV